MPYTEEGHGFQRTDTSLNAIPADARNLRERVLACFHANPFPLTSEEVADLIDCPYPSVQPRISELRNDNRLTDSGVRRIGRYGKPIIAWRLL